MDPEFPQHYFGFTAPESSAPVVSVTEATTNLPPVVPPPPPAPVLHGQQEPLMVPAGSSEALKDLIQSLEEMSKEEYKNLTQSFVPIVDEEPVFKMYQPGGMDCSDCTRLREVVHHSEYRQVYFRVHGGNEPGTFGHATFEIRFTLPVLPPSTHLFFVALYDRRNEWVQHFIASVLDEMQADASGQVHDYCSSFSAAVCSNIAPRSLNRDPYVASTFGNLGGNLSQILAPSTGLSTAAPAAAPPAPPTLPAGLNLGSGRTAFSTAAPRAPWPLPAGSNLVSAGNIRLAHAAGSSATGNGQPARSDMAEKRARTKKLRNLRIEDIEPYLHMNEKAAARELNISSSTLKRFCRLRNLARWPARRVKALNNRIMELEKDAAKGKDIWEVMKEIRELQFQRAEIYAQLEEILEDDAIDEHPSGGNTGGHEPPSPDGGNAGALPVSVN